MAAKAKEDQQAAIYRIYITDALKAIAGNTARMYGGTTISARYYDLITDQPKEDRTGEEIIQDTILGAGLTVIKGDDDGRI